MALDGDDAVESNVAVVVVGGEDTPGTAEESPLARQRQTVRRTDDADDVAAAGARTGAVATDVVGVDVGRTRFEGRRISMNLRLPSWIRCAVLLVIVPSLPDVLGIHKHRSSVLDPN